MAITRVDHNDWARGTTPPLTIRAKNKNTGESISLIGHSVILVIRSEKWDDGNSDDNALVRKRTYFHSAANIEAINSIISPKIGDVAWAEEEGVPFVYDGQWHQAPVSEINPPQGLYTFSVSREEMLIPVGTVYYSIDIKFPNGRYFKITRGKIKITDNTVSGEF
jgi:hypothetical protein